MLWVGVFLKKIIIFLICFILSFKVYAYADLGLSAESAILIETTTGKVIYAKNSEKRMKPASTTKILTALCALEYGNENDIVTVSKKAAYEEGSSMYLDEGEKLKLNDLVYGLMLNSGNDAAVAIAEHLGGTETEFSRLMNEKARETGALNSNFVNPNGLDDDNHYVTAKDLAIITAAALKNENFRKIVATKSKIVTTTQGNKKYLSNHNKMLSMYEGCTGVKTGFTKASGRTLVTSAQKNGIELIAVTLNAPSDWSDHKKMLDYGFMSVEKKILLKKGLCDKTASIENGVKDFVSLLCESEYSDIILKQKQDDYKTEYDIKSLKAPVMENEIAGKVKIFKNGILVHTTNLRASESIAKLKEKLTLWNMFKRFFNYG